MDIMNRFREEETSPEEAFEGVSIMPDGAREETLERIPAEHLLQVSINSIPTYRIVCTPKDLIDLLIGKMVTDGIVASTDDIRSIYLCETGHRAELFVTTEADLSRDHLETVPSCCTGNRTFNDFFSMDEDVGAVDPIPVRMEEVFKAAEEFSNDTPLHASTFGIHSCWVMLDGEVVAFREDIGRHNAFDKAVGAAIQAGADLGKCMVYSSGRLPVDMMMKAVRAKIPVLVTKAVPTDEGVRVAEEHDMTLICQAHPDSAIVYSGYGNVV